MFFFLLRSVGRRDLSAGPEQKKTHHPGCFFFAAAPGKGKGRRSPVGSRHGARAKQKTPPRVFFFCCGPGERQGKEKPRWKPARGQSKKKTPTRVFFFLLRPRGKAGEGEAPLGAGTGPEQKVFFFLLWPRAGFQRGFSFPCLSPGPQQKKKHPGWCFFFALAPCRLPTGLLLPLPFAGAAAKKKTPWVVFFFLLRPRADAHSLTAGLGGDASPSPGRCFFFLLRPRPDRGGVFFVCCGPARTLTHSRWAGAISARPGWCFFFLLRPRRVFLDNSKKCLGYYIGSKKTRRGHSKKKNTTSSRALQTQAPLLSYSLKDTFKGTR